VGKKAGALPEVMGKFSELQSYAKSLKAEYERRIGELEEHIDKMAAGEEGHISAKESVRLASHGFGTPLVWALSLSPLFPPLRFTLTGALHHHCHHSFTINTSMSTKINRILPICHMASPPPFPSSFPPDRPPSLFSQGTRKNNELEAELRAAREELHKLRSEITEKTTEHSTLAFNHAQCDGIQLRLQLTIDEQVRGE